MTGLAGIAYVAGPTEPVGDWAARCGLSQDIVAQLAQAGLESVARQPDDTRAALAGCMSTAVEQAGLRPEDIAAVCFAPPSFEWSRAAEAELFAALALAGFRRAPVIGLGLQGCGAIGAAVEVSAALAQRRQGAVLIVLSALPPGGASFDARSLRLFSCGAGCAVLVPEGGPFRILGTATASDVGLAQVGLPETGTAAFQDSWHLLRAAVGEIVGAAGGTAADFAHLCGSHVNASALLAIAMAAGIPRDRVWAGGLADLGHLYSADALVALAHLERSRRLRPGERILVVGWSDWVIGGLALEYAPQISPAFSRG